MAASSAELNQEALLSFLAERGGRAPNADLLDHFRAFLNSPEPQRRARAREGFKELVNAVATVRQEPGTGAKYVQLRKKYRGGGGALVRPKEAAAAAGEETPSLPLPEAQGGHGRSNRRSGDGWRDAEEDTREAKGVVALLGEPPPPEVTEVPEVLQPRPDGGDGGQAAAAEEEKGAEADPSVVSLAPPGDEASEEEEASLATAATLGDVLTTTTGHTPRCGRRNFRGGERRLGSSPQMKRGGGGGAGDWDSASLASSSAEDESSASSSSSVTLDPLEHAWMLCAASGGRRWESLESLLSCEPALLSKRDFVTGFSCLHWAAKHGRHELLARLVAFARRRHLPVNVDARTSGGGYTALHLAAMHGHLEVVKLLVGAYDADVELRDYSGRKACHYLLVGRSGGTAEEEEVRHLVGALQDDEADNAGGAPNGGSSRWKLSRVLPAQLIAYKLSHHLSHQHPNSAAEEGEGKELSRKASGSGRAKPRLNKIRFRTQIIHTTPSFRGEVEEDGHEERPLKGSFKLRPKSNVFG